MPTDHEPSWRRPARARCQSGSAGIAIRRVEARMIQHETTRIMFDRMKAGRPCLCKRKGRGDG
jgi:hypothetical protein